MKHSYHSILNRATYHPRFSEDQRKAKCSKCFKRSILRSWVSCRLCGRITATITVYRRWVGTICIVTTRIYIFTIPYVILLLLACLVALDERLDDKLDGDFVNSFHIVGVAIAQRRCNSSKKRFLDFLKRWQQLALKYFFCARHKIIGS